MSSSRRGEGLIRLSLLPSTIINTISSLGEDTARLDSSRRDLIQVTQGLQPLVCIVIWWSFTEGTAFQQHDLSKMTCKEQSTIKFQPTPFRTGFLIAVYNLEDTAPYPSKSVPSAADGWHIITTGHHVLFTGASKFCLFFHDGSLETRWGVIL